MIDVNEQVWVFDNTLMTCRNRGNRVTVIIKTTGDSYMGKLQDMPMTMLEKIAEQQYGERIIEQIVRNAEAAFFRAYLED